MRTLGQAWRKWATYTVAGAGGVRIYGFSKLWRVRWHPPRGGVFKSIKTIVIGSLEPYPCAKIFANLYPPGRLRRSTGYCIGSPFWSGRLQGLFVSVVTLWVHPPRGGVEKPSKTIKINSPEPYPCTFTAAEPLVVRSCLLAELAVVSAVF